MIKLFKHNETIKSFQIENDKVFTTIIVGEHKVTNPTLEQFLSAGWEEYTPPEIEQEPYVPSYAELVEQYIREHGYETYGAEIAVINNWMSDPDDPAYVQEYDQYMSVRKAAKDWAREQLNITNA